MTLTEKELIIAGLKASLNISLKLIDSKIKYASLVEKCNLIQKKIDLIQAYSVQVSAICHGKKD